VDVVLPTGVSDLTQPFWVAASDRRLVRPFCGSCQQSFFVPQLACPRCYSESWTYAESAGQGYVYSYSVVHRAPSPEHLPPYVVAFIDLDNEGWYMMSNIIGCPPETVHIGQRVSVCYVDRENGLIVPQFQPVEEAAV